MANRAYHHLYKTKLWRELRLVHLEAHPLCARCEREGRVVPAVEVHHIRAHRGDRALFNDLNNLEGLCKPCHGRVEQSIERRGYDKSVGSDGWPMDDRHPVNGGSGQRPFGFSIPWDTRPVRVPVLLLYGAPGSGKTTHARTYMQEGDTLIDLDEILRELLYPRWTNDPQQLLNAIRERDCRIEQLHTLRKGMVWIVTQAPTREEREEWERALVGAPFALRMMDTSRRECRARINADPRREHARKRLLSAVDAWFAQYSC